VLPCAARYLVELEKAQVLAAPKVREANIRQQAEEAVAAALGKECPGAQALLSGELLAEVVFLVEYPVVVVGRFDRRYLSLPRELLVTVMQRHQRFFPVVDGEGRLCPAFVAVSNTRGDLDLIRTGNERVLRARLEDAEFFFREDQKRPLESFLEGLSGMVYHAALGSYLEKAQRLKVLAGFLAREWGAGPSEVAWAERAGLLCKCDLVTEMVGEFPELQGVMGRYYALASGEPEAVAQAIEEHYWPQGADDQVPRSLVGLSVSVADKVDNLVGCVGVGLLPSGSQDPYALRRQAQGIVGCLLALDAGCRTSLRRMIDFALDLYGTKISRQPDEVRADVLQLIRQRLATRWGGKARYDLVEAVLAAGFDDVGAARRRLEALVQQVGSSGFDSLMVAFRRVARIIPQDESFGPVDERLFCEAAEKELYAEFRQRKGRVKELLASQNFAAALKELAGLREAIDRFFDEVLVMAEAEELRRNRLALLAEIASTFNGIADFSKVVVS